MAEPDTAPATEHSPTMERVIAMLAERGVEYHEPTPEQREHLNQRKSDADRRAAEFYANPAA